MIAIVRMKAQESREQLWDNIVTRVPKLQALLHQEGRLLYLSRRVKHEDVSLFVHVMDSDILGSLIADELSKLDGLTGCWVINLLRPVFFPLPENTSSMSRYIGTAKVFPPRLRETYEGLIHMAPCPGIMMAYVAYTCHLYGDCIQFSTLALDESGMDRYIAENIKALPGILQTTLNYVEKTKPLISYEEWKEYSLSHSLVSAWDEEFMIHQFGNG